VGVFLKYPVELRGAYFGATSLLRCYPIKTYKIIYFKILLLPNGYIGEKEGGCFGTQNAWTFRFSTWSLTSKHYARFRVQGIRKKIKGFY
jgi:hypothetical protein